MLSNASRTLNPALTTGFGPLYVHVDELVGVVLEPAVNVWTAFITQAKPFATPGQRAPMTFMAPGRIDFRPGRAA
jgi:hypothetical protein